MDQSANPLNPNPADTPIRVNVVPVMDTTTTDPANIIRGVAPKPGDKELRLEANQPSATQTNPAPIFPRLAQPQNVTEHQQTPQPQQSTQNQQQSIPVEPRTISQEPRTTTPLDAEEKIFAAIGYVGILALLPLLARRDSEYCQHHGRQALVIAVFFIIFAIFAQLSSVLMIIMFLLQLLAIIGGGVLAYRGEWFHVPLIYDLSLKLKLDKK